MTDFSQEIRHWYADYLDYLKCEHYSGEITLGRHFLCPCCYFPTLNARSGYEICAVCWWEDTGQDDENAEEHIRGPNHQHSLTEARTNFIDHLNMFDDGKEISAVNEPSDQRKILIVYVNRVLDGDIELSIADFQELLQRCT